MASLITRLNYDDFSLLYQKLSLPPRVDDFQKWTSTIHDLYEYDMALMSQNGAWTLSMDKAKLRVTHAPHRGLNGEFGAFVVLKR